MDAEQDRFETEDQFEAERKPIMQWDQIMLSKWCADEIAEHEALTPASWLKEQREIVFDSIVAGQTPATWFSV